MFFNYLCLYADEIAMNVKLTLTIQDSVISKAKQYAKINGRSLSDIVENYLKTIASEDSLIDDNIELTPIVKSMKGAFKAPSDFNYKEELGKRLAEKYLENE